MNDKQEQIEKMSDIKSILIKTHKRCRTLQEDYMQDKYAEELYKAGYRKQSDTAREILKELKFLYVERQKEYTNWDGNKINAIATEWLNADIESIAEDYGVEVEEWTNTSEL